MEDDVIPCSKRLRSSETFSLDSNFEFDAPQFVDLQEEKRMRDRPTADVCGARWFYFEHPLHEPVVRPPPPKSLLEEDISPLRSTSSLLRHSSNNEGKENLRKEKANRPRVPLFKEKTCFNDSMKVVKSSSNSGQPISNKNKENFGSPVYTSPETNRSFGSNRLSFYSSESEDDLNSSFEAKQPEKPWRQQSIVRSQLGVGGNASRVRRDDGSQGSTSFYGEEQDGESQHPRSSVSLGSSYTNSDLDTSFEESPIVVKQQPKLRLGGAAVRVAAHSLSPKEDEQSECNSTKDRKKDVVKLYLQRAQEKKALEKNAVQSNISGGIAPRQFSGATQRHIASESSTLATRSRVAEKMRTLRTVRARADNATLDEDRLLDQFPSKPAEYFEGPQQPQITEETTLLKERENKILALLANESKKETILGTAQRIEKAPNVDPDEKSRHLQSHSHIVPCLTSSQDKSYVETNKKNEVSLRSKRCLENEQCEGLTIEEKIARHNKRVMKEKTIYVPRQHSTRIVKLWEKLSGKTYYNLTASERLGAHEEMDKLQRNPHA